jgi:hypothetical protein
MPCFVMPHTEYQTTDHWVRDDCTFVGLTGLCIDRSKKKLKINCSTNTIVEIKKQKIELNTKNRYIAVLSLGPQY